MKTLQTLLFFIVMGALSFFPAAASDLFIQNAQLITVSRGTIENGSLWVKDGKIAALGANLSAPEGATVIDAGGRPLTPGLIDLHSHIGVYSFPEVAANSDGNEATSPVTAEVRAIDSFNVHDPEIGLALSGGVTTVQVLVGSANCIGGQIYALKLRENSTVEAMLIPEAYVGMKMAMGENPKRVYGGRGETPSTRMGSAAVMRQAFTDARDYMNKWDRYERGDWGDDEEPPEHNLRLEALAGVLKGEIKPNVHCYTVTDIMTLYRIADEFGFEIRAIHHALETYKVADELARRGTYAVTFSDLWGYKHEAYYATERNAALLHEAGVKVCVHTDNPVIEQRYYIHEAAKAVKYGLPADAGYKAITLYPAEVLGLERKMGSLDVGKDADLVLWSADPYEIDTKVDWTMVDGEIVYERKASQ